MADIPAKLVMDLRKSTGMPMMKCKSALEAADGDFEKAVDILRKEGMKTAEKKAGRATGEGLIGLKLADDHRSGVMVLVVCETEPVKNTPMFVDFVDQVTSTAAAQTPADLDALKALPWEGEADTVADALKALIGKIGENMNVAGYRHFSVEEGVVGAYVHHDKKTASMVALEGGADLDDFAKDLCMHVVFSKPQVLSRDQIDATEVAKEEAFLRTQIAEDPAMKGKPEQALAGILKGRLEKNFFGTRVLTEQPWFRPDKGNKKVADLLKEHGTKIADFVLFQPGV